MGIPVGTVESQTVTAISFTKHTLETPLSLSDEPTIKKLRSLVDCKNKHEDCWLMTKEKQRRYNPAKKLRPDSHVIPILLIITYKLLKQIMNQKSAFASNNGCIFFRFQRPEK